jgi:Tfp pilus assembly protein PilF
MKNKWFVLVISLFAIGSVYAQDKAQAEKLVNEGVALEDNGKSDEALLKYQQALDADKDNITALAEMAYSLLSLQQYENAIKYCKFAIQTHPGDKILASVYVTYGTAYDGLKNTKKSLDIYNEGIKQFPDYYALYYNKGITLTRVSKLEESLNCFEKAVSIKPNHPGSNYAIGTVCITLHKRIPALMAYCRLIVIEPESERSKQALTNIKLMMSDNVKKTDDKNITVNVNDDMLDVSNKKKMPNNFSGAELNLTMASALDYDSATKSLTAVENFKRKIDIVCETLKETRTNNTGFFWDYYAPYFIEMKDKDLTTVFSYIAFSSSGEVGVTEWISKHKSETEAFFKWSEGFNRN